MSSSEFKVAIHRLQVEHLRETLGVDTHRPHLSWQIKTDIQNWMQSTYEVECYRADGQLKEKTGRVESSQSILVDWAFESLQSRERVNLRVRVWGTDSSESDWSEAVTVEAGLLSTDDWSASFITPDWEEDTSKSNPSPYLRREFELKSDIKSARLYITALGLYEAQINGKVVGDHVLAPGWTVYDEHLRYQTFDVTNLLQPGSNAIGAMLGDDAEKNQMGEEYYPEAIGGTIRHASKVAGIPVIVTENGLSSNDDSRRLEYFQRALRCVVDCLKSGIDVRGYFCWSAMDNFEWVSGYGPKFGIIEVNRATQKRTPKPSAYWLGNIARKNQLQFPT